MLHSAIGRRGISQMALGPKLGAHAPKTSGITKPDPTQKQSEEIKAIGKRVSDGQATSEDVYKLRDILNTLPSSPVGKSDKVAKNALQTLVLIASTSEDGVIRSQAVTGIELFDSTGDYLRQLARKGPTKVQATSALQRMGAVEEMAQLP